MWYDDFQVLLAEKEEGMHILQIALDNLQMVLPNTSVAGRDAMRRDMQAMQQDYDALSGRLVDARSSLEGTLAQWTVYDDSLGQLVRWMQELENQVSNESQLQNTMQEKKLQLERVKVLKFIPKWWRFCTEKCFKNLLRLWLIKIFSLIYWCKCVDRILHFLHVLSQTLTRIHKHTCTFT